VIKHLKSGTTIKLYYSSSR